MIFSSEARIFLNFNRLFLKYPTPTPALNYISGWKLSSLFLFLPWNCSRAIMMSVCYVNLSLVKIFTVEKKMIWFTFIRLKNPGHKSPVLGEGHFSCRLHYMFSKKVNFPVHLSISIGAGVTLGPAELRPIRYA